MAVYVLAVIAVVVLLAVSYRAFGGGDQLAPLPTLVLTSASVRLDDNLRALSAVLGDLSLPPSEQVLREGRRGAAALQQHLDRLPPHESLQPSEATRALLLQAAGQDLAWAWRMLATSGIETNPGLCAALTALRDHAAECARTAAALLEPSILEPAEGSGKTSLE